MSLDLIDKCFNEHLETFSVVRDSLKDKIQVAGNLIVDALKNNNTLFLCGNGGSAADAQHIAAELTGRFVKERKPLPAIALTTDTSALTAIGNDYGYSLVFARQLEALGKEGDVLIAISTSGNSENIIKAIVTANERNIKVIGLSGKNGGSMNQLCDINLIVPSTITARIQEMHILIGHIFCDIIDNEY